MALATPLSGPTGLSKGPEKGETPVNVGELAGWGGAPSFCFSVVRVSPHSENLWTRSSLGACKPSSPHSLRPSPLPRVGWGSWVGWGVSGLICLGPPYTPLPLRATPWSLWNE